GAAGAVAAGLVLAPCAFPYVPVPAACAAGGRRSVDIEDPHAPPAASLTSRLLGRRFDAKVIEDGAADVQNYLAPMPESRAPWMRALSRFGAPEAVFFPGLAGVALAGVALTLAAQAPAARSI